MEPAVHIEVGLVVQGPFCSGCGTDRDGDEISRQDSRNGEEHNHTAGLGTAGELIEKDQSDKDDNQHAPLGKGVSPVNMEKHTN